MSAVAVLDSPEPAVFVPTIDHPGHLMEVHFNVQGDELAATGKALAPNA